LTVAAPEAAAVACAFDFAVDDDSFRRIGAWTLGVFSTWLNSARSA
jgi:hypothetical protein